MTSSFVSCQKVKDCKDRRREERLTRCMTESASKTLLEAAQIGQHERILIQMQSGGDTIAADVMYHRTCYADFTHYKSLRQKQAMSTSEVEVTTDRDEK